MDKSLKYTIIITAIILIAVILAIGIPFIIFLWDFTTFSHETLKNLPSIN